MTLLVGHRGVGKTTLIRWLRSEGYSTLDLDEEVERQTQTPIAHLLAEGRFRELERRTLAQLNADFIAVGAGFEGPPPPHAKVLWIRRRTDPHGRSFLHRPRLDATQTPLEEYLSRFDERERRYRQWAHEELTLPEINPDEPTHVEKLAHVLRRFFSTVPLNAAITWLAHHRVVPQAKWIEIRDDLLTPAQIAQALTQVEPSRVLWSCRTSQPPPHNVGAIDWALELGEPPSPATIVSLHEGTVLDAPTDRSEIVKLAVEVETWDELLKGHLWWQHSPTTRAFLPRSRDGRWQWYRSLFGPRMPIHFVREGEGSSLDQPLLWQALLQPELKTEFAAVLGSPVVHSLSPIEHHNSKRPFVAIEVREHEWSDALEVLRRLGLCQAAVTSPLKSLAGGNTLDLRQNAVANTDLLALKQLAAENPAPSVWLWGGGGVQASVLQAWPHARVISARQGLRAAEPSPDLVIWAVGRSRQPSLPPEWLRPKKVLDLNYTADSPGLEWAVARGLNYQSGHRMFKLQAEAQKRFWGEI